MGRRSFPRLFFLIKKKHTSMESSIKFPFTLMILMTKVGENSPKGRWGRQPCSQQGEGEAAPLVKREGRTRARAHFADVRCSRRMRAIYDQQGLF